MYLQLSTLIYFYFTKSKKNIWKSFKTTVELLVKSVIKEFEGMCRKFKSEVILFLRCDLWTIRGVMFMYLLEPLISLRWYDHHIELLFQRFLYGAKYFVWVFFFFSIKTIKQKRKTLKFTPKIYNRRKYYNWICLGF